MKKDQKTDIEGMIMGAHYLHALDLESMAQKPLADMERQDYIDQNNTLKETVDCLRRTIEYSEKMRETESKQREVESRKREAEEKKNAALQATISDLVKEISLLRKELSKQNDINNRHNKMSFGKRSLKSSTRQDQKRSREEEKDAFDNSKAGESKATDAAVTNPALEEGSCLDKTKVKSEMLDGKRGSRGPYTQREAARVVHLKTSMQDDPSSMRFIFFKNIEEYNRISYVDCTCFEVAVYEDEFGIRHEYYSPEIEGDNRYPKLNVVAGTPCTPEFLSDLIVDRWMIHTPNHRANIRMQMDKFQSSENSRSNWVKAGANLLKPLYNYFKTRLLNVKSVLNIDETWCRVRIKYKNDGTKLGRYFKKYIWVLVNKIEKVVYFLYDNDEDDSRGTRPIHDFLGGFKGTIQSDGYVVYKHLAKAHPENPHILCWAHVRAKFKFAADISKAPDAEWFVEQIGRLYKVEAENVLFHRSPNEIKKRRAGKDITGILSAIHKKADKMQKNKYLHYGDMMSTALTYMLNGWDDLLNYRNDGRYTIDNMLAERSIRPFTVNRKNSLHFSSEEGITVAMTYLTIIETAKMYGLEVRDYLAHVFRELVKGNKDCSTYTPEAYLA